MKHGKNNMKRVRTILIMLLAGLGLTGVTTIAEAAISVSVTLAWDAPTETISGHSLTNMESYKLFYGTEPGSYTQMMEVDAAQTSATITGLERGATYYFTIKACTLCHCESDEAVEIVWTAPSMVDTDADGLDDEWELTHFSCLTAACGVSDSDQDGLSDVCEYIAGTHPDDPDEYPSMKVVFENGQMFVAISTISTANTPYENRTRFYALERSTNLGAGVWQTVSGYEQVAGNGSDITYAASAQDPTAFYKMRVWLD